ncbi:MAG: glycosyltransferase family 2 protein [Verrucomicrobiota bacterium]|nr:glycosyltransferase family 2 protein [Verrucomicrobiota bacterium]
MKLSFCVITNNEAENLPRCLNSFRDLADEIVVIDSGSTDHTKKIAQEFGAVVFDEPWQGFVAQKNMALAKASHDWVFSIDADEELSGDLHKEIALLKNAGPGDYDGFILTRCVFYEGKWIRHGDWYPDRVLRVFSRTKARFAGGKVHERVEGPTRTKIVPGDLFHYSYKDRTDQLKRIDRYSTLWAETQYENKSKSQTVLGSLHAGARFLRGYLLKAGFLDGAHGMTIARLNAYEVYLKYKKLNALYEQAKRNS